MSASLVGSEMCIRDRPSAAPPGATPEAPYVQSLRRNAPIHLRDLASPGSVSYTHLTLPTICSV
eukprot:790354-Alexandrium_andersonii.AAC.1